MTCIRNSLRKALSKCYQYRPLELWIKLRDTPDWFGIFPSKIQNSGGLRFGFVMLLRQFFLVKFLAYFVWFFQIGSQMSGEFSTFCFHQYWLSGIFFKHFEAHICMYIYLDLLRQWACGQLWGTAPYRVVTYVHTYTYTLTYSTHSSGNHRVITNSWEHSLQRGLAVRKPAPQLVITNFIAQTRSSHKQSTIQTHNDIPLP